MPFPTDRPRRLRRSEGIRALVRETEVAASDLILPLFVTEGSGVRRAIERLPGAAAVAVAMVIAPQKVKR